MNGANDILKMALSIMEKTISPVTLSAWFDDAEVVSLAGDRLVLRASGQFKKEIIEDRFLTPLGEAVAQLLGGPIQISVIVGDEAPAVNTLLLVHPTNLRTQPPSRSQTARRKTITRCSSMGSPASARPTCCTPSAM